MHQLLDHTASAGYREERGRASGIGRAGIGAGLHQEGHFLRRLRVKNRRAAQLVALVGVGFGQPIQRPQHLVVGAEVGGFRSVHEVAPDLGSGVVLRRCAGVIAVLGIDTDENQETGFQDGLRAEKRGAAVRIDFVHRSIALILPDEIRQIVSTEVRAAGRRVHLMVRERGFSASGS
ncbi:MAG: hypothetical protein EPN58_11230 [Rhodanobacter sp.]|nr:MAG: hypothetical protein EPN58_11230 [Rhodanobacter sp.]